METFQDFTDQFSMHRASNEAFKNYEARFASQVENFSAHGESICLHKSLLAMMLFSGVSVDDTQIIPILSSSGGLDAVDNQQSNYDIIQALKSEKIASFLKQCDAGVNNSI